jgi:2-dehydropantoate 2-reductase
MGTRSPIGDNARMRIAVVGTGGVGAYFGGRLAQAGESVAFVARGAHLAAIRAQGLRVDSVAGDFAIVPAEASDDLAAIGPVDVVLLGVKAWQVSETARTLGPLLGPDTFAVPLQNGVTAADELAAVLGPERVLGGLCRIVSAIVAPGHVRHSGVAAKVEFGERAGGTSDRVLRLAEAFARAQGLTVEIPGDVEAAIWEKFLFIAPVSGVGAVTRQPVGVTRTTPESRRLLEQAMEEIEALARARGVALQEGAVARNLAYVDRLPSDSTASMQRDIVDGRPSELEQQTGAVVRLARAAGVPVPVNTFLYAALLPAERQARGTA